MSSLFKKNDWGFMVALHDLKPLLRKIRNSTDRWTVREVQDDVTAAVEIIFRTTLDPEEMTVRGYRFPSFRAFPVGTIVCLHPCLARRLERPGDLKKDILSDFQRIWDPIADALARHWATKLTWEGDR